MTAKKALIVGCSLSAGFKMIDGIDQHAAKDNSKDYCNPTHPSIWANQLLSNLDNFEIVNLSKSGVNNTWIFMEAMSALTQTHYDLVLIQWTYLDRVCLPVGLEQYHTHTMLAGENDINLVNNVTISAKWLRDVGQRLRLLHNYHWDILNLVRYVNILKHFQLARQAKVCFINGAIEWNDGFFDRKQFGSPNELSQFEQDILNVKNRDDLGIVAIYNMIHDQYQASGTHHPHNWLNIYDSLLSCKIDEIAPKDLHPGYLSQDLFVEQLFPVLKKYYEE